MTKGLIIDPAVVRAHDAERRDRELLQAVAAYIQCPVVTIWRTLGHHELVVEIAYGATDAVVDISDLNEPDEIAERCAIAGRAAWWTYQPPPDAPNIIRGDQ